MRCIFCAQPSDRSVSREHILPESLGNKEHCLPPGVVCDRCNNYFARKVERPLLETGYFVSLRSRQLIPNKRDLFPVVKGIFTAARMAIGLQHTEEGVSVGPFDERDTRNFVKAIMSRRSGRFYIPVPMPVPDGLLARFLAKTGVEVLAHSWLRNGGKADDLLDMPELAEIRRCARHGDQPFTWPFSRRRLYPEDATFDSGRYQVLHEFNLFITDANEWYAVVCIFGEEFAINLGGPSIEGYEAFLTKERGRSPLYRAGELELPPERFKLFTPPSNTKS